MKRLILTSSDSGAGGLTMAKLADCVLSIAPRLVSGPLPSPAQFKTWLSSRAATDPGGRHWLDDVGNSLAPLRAEGPGLTEFCDRFDAVELWIDPDPNSQLTLVWLLDFLRDHGSTAAKLALVQADAAIGDSAPERGAGSRPSARRITNEHVDLAGLAWQAWRKPTPQDVVGLLDRDLGALPQLRHSVLELLEELPLAATGLGATEMRMLELSAAGDAGPFDLFPGDNKRNQRRVYGYWEVGALLDGLAGCPEPVLSGLDDGPFTLEMHEDRDRHERYRRSRLALTALGESVLAGTADFSRHNPLHRWWGGTELTSDRLWRWDPANRALIAP